MQKNLLKYINHETEQMATLIKKILYQKCYINIRFKIKIFIINLSYNSITLFFSQ